tara:strand:- start:376 stop:639 length:264 start_codon:yes stop_codon:yes gene_type:complete
MKRLSIFFVAAALVFSGLSLQAQNSDAERKSRMEERRGKGGKGRGADDAPKVGTQAPDLGVRKKLNGEDINLSTPNKIAVLVFGSHT